MTLPVFLPAGESNDNDGVAWSTGRNRGWGMVRAIAKTFILFRPMFALFDSIGAGVIAVLGYAAFLTGTTWAALVLALRASTWRRTVRDVLARQILFTAVEGVPFLLRISVAVGILVVVQAELWARHFGSEPGLLEPFLWQIIVHELAPLLATLLVIVRSSTAMAAEMANMRLNGELEVLDAQGLDPMTYLVVPRVVAMSISVFCMSVLFVAATFVAGYAVGALMGVFSGGPAVFFNRLFSAAGREDLSFFLPKTLVAGVFIGVISSVEGLSVRRALTEVPQATSRAAVRSLTAVFLISAVLSLLIYGRVLIFEVS